MEFLKKLLLFITLAIVSTNAFAEGIKELNPNGLPGNKAGDFNEDIDLGDITLLVLAPSTGAYFATYSDSTTSYLQDLSMCFTVKEVGETVYFAFSDLAQSDARLSTPLDSVLRWRVYGPSGVAHGPFESHGNGNDYGEAAAGPMQVVGAGGYDASNEFTFQPTEPGEYCFEFDERMFPKTSRTNRWIYLRNLDVSITSADDPSRIVPGRLYSKEWSLVLECDTHFTDCDSIATDEFGGLNQAQYQNAFNGTFYILTEDNFVLSLDLDPMMLDYLEGFRPYVFTVLFNDRGPSGTVDSDFTFQRTSSPNIRNPNQFPPDLDLYPVYLNPPDTACYEKAILSVLEISDEVVCEDEGLCIEYTISTPGNINIFLDLNGDGEYTSNTKDVLLSDRIEITDGITPGVPFTQCVYWDGLDGFGNPYFDSNSVTELNIVNAEFRQGETHFMAFDVEYNDVGWELNIIDPPAGVVNFDGLFYWDDSRINNRSNIEGERDVNLTGSEFPAHLWDLLPDQSDDDSKGDKAILNTWFFAHKVELQKPVDLKRDTFPFEKTAELLDNIIQDGIPQAGETIKYTFRLKNNTDLPISNIPITDGVIFDGTRTIEMVPARDSADLCVNYIITQEDIDRGLVINQADAEFMDGCNVTNELVSDDPSTLEPMDSTITLLPQLDSITITKTGVYSDTNESGFGDLGDRIFYSFMITNVGNTTLTNVEVTDPQLEFQTMPIPELAPGETNTTSYFGVYLLTNEDVDRSFVTNLATVTGTGPSGGEATAQDSTRTDFTTFSDVMLIKQGNYEDENGNQCPDAGESINYQFMVMNTGNTTLDNFELVDDRITVIGDISSLEPGVRNSDSYTGTYTIQQEDIDRGFYANRAVVNAQDPQDDMVSDESSTSGGVEDSTIVNLKIASGIELEKSFQSFIDVDGNTFSNVGDQLTYTFLVRNVGNSTLRNIQLQDDKAVVSVNGTVPETLAPGDVFAGFTAVYTLDQDDVDNGEVTNIATTMATDPLDQQVQDTDMANATLDATDSRIQLDKIGSFTDENGDGIAQPGETIRYRFIVTNVGLTTLFDAEIFDDIVTVTGVNIATLVPNEVDSTSFTASYILTQDDINRGILTNQALVSATDPFGDTVTDISDDPTSIMPNDSTDTEIPNVEDIQLFKEGEFVDANDDNYAQIGEQILYTFTARNTGNTTLTAIMITDPKVELLDNAPFTLQPTEENTIQGRYTLVENDILEQIVINTAIASGNNGVFSAQDISDDPNDPTNIDLEDDGEPDDSTKVAICGVLPGTYESAFDVYCANENTTANLRFEYNRDGLIPDNYKTVFFLSNTTTNAIVDYNPDEPFFDVNIVGEYSLNPVLIDTVVGSDNYFDTDIFDSFNNVLQLEGYIENSDVCARMTRDVVTVPVENCDIDLEQFFMAPDTIIGDNTGDVTVMYRFEITNNGGTPVKDLDLRKRISFLNQAFPETPLNDKNIIFRFVSSTAEVDPLFNLDYDGVTVVDMFQQNSGLLNPGETYVFEIDTRVNVALYYEFVLPRPSTEIAFLDGTAVDFNGRFLGDVEDEDPVEVLVPRYDICDALVCIGDVNISLNGDCTKVITKDDLIQNPATFGNYTTFFYDKDGNLVATDTLTVNQVGDTLTYKVCCLDNCCWGTIIVEANSVPQLSSPCACDESGFIREECMISCASSVEEPPAMVTVEEARDMISGCSPDIIGDIIVEEHYEADTSTTIGLCREGGILVTRKYIANFLIHGEKETVEILCQNYRIVPVDLADNDNTQVIHFPMDLQLECDAMYHPEEIAELLMDSTKAYPSYIDRLVPAITIDSVPVDTIKIEDPSQSYEKEIYEMRDIDNDGEDEWIKTVVVEHVYVDSIIYRRDTTEGPALVPITDKSCNLLVSYADTEFDACAGGKKLIRTWTIIDWCDSNVTVDGHQVIEIADFEAPMFVKKHDDVQISIEPWECFGTYHFPELSIKDNCDEDLIVNYRTLEGRIEDGYVTDLWISDEPTQVYVDIVDDCGNIATDTFQIVVSDLVPPTVILHREIDVNLVYNEGGTFAKIFADAFNSDSHDSKCSDITVKVVRLEDWEDEVLNCENKIAGYRPKSCNPNISEVDLGETEKSQCVYLKENLDTLVAAPGDYVEFCCEDADKIIPVLVFVYDENGNVATGTSDVRVTNKVQASLTCEDVYIDCDDDLDNIPYPDINGALCNVGSDIIMSNIVDNMNNCGVGEILREFFIDFDGDGEIGIGEPVCTQKIINNDARLAFDPNNIRWPKHYDGKDMLGINIECDTLENGDVEIYERDKSIEMGEAFDCLLDAEVSEPIFCEEGCNLITIRSEIDTLTASDACAKYIKRWTVIDWCTFEANSDNIDDDNDSSRDQFVAVEDWATGECLDCTISPDGALMDSVYIRYEKVEVDGYYTFDQIILIDDKTKPTIQVEDVVYVDIFEGNSSKADDESCYGIVQVTASGHDQCDGTDSNSELLWDVRVLDSDGDTIKTETGKSTFYFRGDDVTMTSFEGEPGDAHTIKWTVRDACGNIGYRETTVIFRDNKAPVPICISGVTTKSMDDSGTLEIWANDFDFGSFDQCCSQDELQFSIVRRGGTALTPDQEGFDYQTSYTFTCEDIPFAGNMDVYVWDCHGNSSVCTIAILVNGDPCDGGEENGSDEGALASISGYVNDMYGKVIDDVEVNLQSASQEKTIMNDEEGFFAFADNPMNENYIIKANKEEDEDYLKDKISAKDLLLIQQYIIGIRDFDSPYLMLAADLNEDGKVSSRDLVQLRKFLLGIEDLIPGGSAWRFVNANQEFYDKQNPWDAEDFIQINDMSSDMSDRNFIGLLRGNIEFGENIEERNADYLVLSMNQSTSTEQIEVYSEKSISAGVLSLNTYGVTIDEIVSGQLEITEQDYVIEDDRVTLILTNVNNYNVNSDQPLFTMLSRDNDIRFEVNRDKTRVYNDQLSEYNGVLISESNIKQGGIAVHAAPNPFSATTTLSVSSASDFVGALKVYSPSGQELLVKENIEFGKGVTSIQIAREELQHTGLVYYSIESPNQVVNGKLLIIE